MNLKALCVVACALLPGCACVPPEIDVRGPRVGTVHATGCPGVHVGLGVEAQGSGSDLQRGPHGQALQGPDVGVHDGMGAGWWATS